MAAAKDTRISAIAEHPRRSDLPNKHQLKTEEMRKKLLKSARKIFARDGFEAARLEDIAKDAGHTRGAFYAHFSSKEHLFFALVEGEIRQQLQNVRALMDSDPSPEGKLQVLRDFYVSRLTNTAWSMLNLEFKMFAVRHPKARARLASAHRAMRASIQANDGITGLIAPYCRHSDTSFDETKVILETFLNSLALQSAYDPITLPASQAQLVLGRVFDFLLSAK